MAAIDFLSGIDLNLTELQNAVVHLLASDPGSPVEGQLWYNTTTHRLKFRTNSTTIDVTDALTLGGQNLAYVLARANHTGTQAASTISDLATVVKAYRLDEFAVPTADVSLNSHKLTNVTDPSSAQDAATKAYVDSISSGLDPKGSVRAATTAAGTLATSFENGDAIDGVTLATGDRILIKDQAAGAENGIYVVAASGAPTRAADANTSAEVTGGMFVFVEEGTVNADTGWLLSTNNAITLGTTALTFVQFSAAGQIVAGAGLTKTANTIDVGAGTGITVAADSISIDTAVVTRKAAFNSVGDGAATSYVLTHNLNTRDVMCSLRDNSTPWAIMQPSFEATSVNTVTVRFSSAPTSAQYSVVVMG